MAKSRDIYHPDLAESAATAWSELHDDVDEDAVRVALRIRQAGDRLNHRLDEDLTTFGLSVVGDYDVLSTLRRVGPVTPSELARTLRITRAGITGRIRRLTEVGYLETVSSPNDSRSYKVRLSRQGRSVVDKAFRNSHAIYRDIMADLSPAEMATLADLLSVVLARLEKNPAPGGQLPADSH